MLGNLNGWVENRVKEDITDVFRVLGENDNRKVVKVGCVLLTNFEHKFS